jgi:diguanylate cyclase (GGDEF)-like protein
MAPSLSADRISTLWNRRLADPEGTLGLIEALLAESLQLAPLLRARALTCQAVCLVGSYRLSGVKELVQRVQAQLAARNHSEPELESELFRCQATLAFHAENDGEAMRLSRLSLEQARKAENRELIALAHSNIAAVFGKASEFKSALRHLQISLHLTTDSESSHYAVLLNNLGNVYLHLERTDEALVCFLRSRNVFEKRRSSLMAGIALVNVGRAYEKLRLYQKALVTLEQGLQEFRSGGFTTYVPSVLYKLGSVHAAMGNPAQAEALFLEAVGHYDLDQESGFEGDTRQAYAEFLLSRSRVADAIEQLELVRSIYLERSAPEGQTAVLELLASAYELAGDTTLALAAMKEYIRLKDERAAELARVATPGEASGFEALPDSEHELVELTTEALLAANRQLAIDSRELEQLAMTDHLTGLRNRHYLAEALGHVSTGHRAGDGAFSLVMLDIDQFKLVNDAHGYSTGDAVLQRLARILTGSVRGTDIVTRWGGEEFIVFLSQAPLAVAAKVAEKLRQRVENHDWNELVAGLRITISLGVVHAGDHPDLDVDGLIAHVDSLLYEAKGQGRNRVLLATDAATVSEAG